MSNEKDDILLRHLAMEVLLKVTEEEEYSNVVLKAVLDKYNYLDGKKKAFIKKLAAGCLERKIQLDYVIDCFSKTKVTKMKPVIRIILEMGVYQILFMDSVYDTTACNLSVSLAKKKGFQGLTGFVNGVLRSVCRGKDAIVYPDPEQDFAAYASVVYSMPEWIVKLWLSQYGQEVCEIMLNATLQTNSVSLRLRGGLAEKEKNKVMECIREKATLAEEHPYCKDALRISGADSIERLYGYKEGFFTVQDVSSMLVCECAGMEPGMKVLDVCAAPGGKTMHAADKVGEEGVVHAFDVSERKVERICENIARMGYTNVTASVADARVLQEEYVESADVVLADVPCSGLGVLGKKTDIKYRVTPAQIEEIVALQRSILSNVYKYVKKGGILLYSTCTVNRLENNENVIWMTENLPLEVVSMEAYLPEDLKADMKKAGQNRKDLTLQLLPGVCKCDGFYIAKLRRI